MRGLNRRLAGALDNHGALRGIDVREAAVAVLVVEGVDAAEEHDDKGGHADEGRPARERDPADAALTRHEGPALEAEGDLRAAHVAVDSGHGEGGEEVLAGVAGEADLEEGLALRGGSWLRSSRGCS